MHIKIRGWQELWFSVYIFLVIFAPPVMPKFRFAIGILTAIYILTIRISEIKKVIIRTRIYVWAIGIVFFLLHMFFMLLINELVYGDTVNFSHYTSLYNRFLISLIEILPCCIYIIVKLNKYHCGIDRFFVIIFRAALIEAVMVALTIISPNIKFFFNQLALLINKDSLIENRWYVTVRSYGFADTLLDTFGWGTGLLAGLSLIYGVFIKRKYVIVSFVLLISPLFNARTGIVMYALAFFTVIIYGFIKWKWKVIIQLVLGILLLIILLFITWQIIADYYPATAGWIENGLRDIAAVFFNHKTNSKEGFGFWFYEKSWWELPPIPRILTGTGHSRYMAEGYKHSDFGYVNDIWAGGIYGCIVLYGSALLFTMGIYKKLSKCYRVMVIYMLLTLFAFNVKGCAYGCNSGLVTYVLVAAYINYYYNSQEYYSLDL